MEYLLLGLLVFIAPAGQSHSYTISHVLDAMGPDVLVQIGIDAHVTVSDMRARIKITGLNAYDVFIIF